MRNDTAGYISAVFFIIILVKGILFEGDILPERPMDRAFVAVYARISRKDEEGSSERSIDNQIQLARAYIERDAVLSQMQIRIFQDEGYTGTNLHRPAVQKLLASIYLGRIQALVVKDFSRLSRNHIQMSALREDTFCRYSVIFVSVADGYDSRKRGMVELGSGIRSIFNEYYCRDVSRKVKYALETKKQSGEYAVSRAPFGYRRGKDGRFVVCPQEADKVRKIFQMASEGHNCAQIADWLNRQQGGEKQISNKQQMSVWQPSKIWRILNNPVYLGVHVWHKYESVYQNGFCTKCLNPNQWRTQENGHPAMISRELFELAVKRQKRTAGYQRKKGKRHIFHGITRCGVCNEALCRHRREREWLVCRKGHTRISCGLLLEICNVLWEGEDIGSLPEWEQEFFLHHFLDKIWVNPDKQIFFRWRMVR